jgi:(E)-4-hydroxy-3-methylbut-2-enyl-diphosphate synthase
MTELQTLAPRRPSKPIRIGDVVVGGDAPISVQSMTKTDTRDVKATVRQIWQLEEEGCEIVRLAVPDQRAAEALGEIKKHVRIPIVADIHFHYQYALEALRQGVDGLRLNPGNIRDAEKVKLVVQEAKARQVPIRVGVNFGSLPPVPYNKALGPNPSVVDRMIDAALWEIGILEALDFDLIKVSLKAFDVPTTVEAYRRIAKLIPYPLHLGITEAGTVRAGTIRSAVGLGILLAEGIGDTIRVSLSGDPVEEVYVGFQILKSLNLRQQGPVLVACPSCGRADVDIRKLADLVETELKEIKEPIKVAVMGCEVNGPGEGKDADVGIAAGVGKAVIFRKGKKSRIVDEADMLPALLEEIRLVLAERQGAAQAEVAP